LNILAKLDTLNKTHPSLLKQWDYKRNNGVSLSDFSKGSSKKVWWNCPVGADHIWEATIAHRVNGRGCPICAGKKIVKSNCLETRFPDIAKEWHPTKNGSLTPNTVSTGSHKKVWWKCPKGDDHEWQNTIGHRTSRNQSCPICSGRKVSLSNCLKTLHPKTAKQWHPTKNGKLTPMDLVPGSNKKVWWECPKGDDHEWQTTVWDRINKSNCPICSNRKIVKSNCLATTHPKLALEWYQTRNNNLTPFNVVAGTEKKVWWKCSKGDDHIWEALISNRTRNNSGCSVCAGLTIVKSNCLSTTHPHIAEQWHPIKNGKKTPDNFVAGTPSKVWWKCPKGDDHEWKARINSRTGQNVGCPICAGFIAVKSNCLSTTNPKIAKQWHSTKNGDLTPDMYVSKSGKSVWWKCPKGDDHEWKARIADRTSGQGCSVCAGLTIVKSNCLLTTHPHIAKQWHSTKNGVLTPNQVIAGSHKKVWWKCSKGDDHVWLSSIAHRVNGRNCSVCAGKKVVESNCLNTTHPQISKQWHPNNNGELTPFSFTAGAHKRIWWQCDIDKTHEWITSIPNRIVGTGCPYCSLTPQSKEELIIQFELKSIFPNIRSQGYKTKINGKIYSIDIFIKDYNAAIEYDGSYWHREKTEYDRQKTKILTDNGITVIRLRQSPLKKLFKNDIVVKSTFNGKIITNKIFKKIKSTFNISQQVENKIDSYLLKDGLQNEEALNRYIERLLIEKKNRKLAIIKAKNNAL
jgi:hypothetical protein